jgi:hypothetical protein
MRLAAIGFAYPVDSLEARKTMKGVVADFCKLAE